MLHKSANQRQYSIDKFYQAEKDKILSGEPTTRKWTIQQKKEIISGKKPTFNNATLEGHHKYNVKNFPQQADNLNNIYPATK